MYDSTQTYTKLTKLKLFTYQTPKCLHGKGIKRKLIKENTMKRKANIHVLL